MLLKISTDSYNELGADAVVSDKEMEQIIIKLQRWGIEIKNPFIKEVNTIEREGGLWALRITKLPKKEVNTKDEG